MKKIEVKDVITLSDNNKYVVCSKINYKGENYLHLIDLGESSNIKFGMEKIIGERISIVEIKNEDLIRMLIPLLYNEAKEILDNLEEQ